MATHQHKIELNAQVRTIMGGKVKAVRQAGFVPAVLYGKEQEPIALQVPLKDFNKTYKSAGESTLVYLSVDGKAYPTIIHDIARDPVSDDILHADFFNVNLKEKIKTKIPVSFDGESPAVRDLGGIFIRNINELEVEALPTDLPHEIKIDIAKLEKFGDQILLKDIDLGDKVTILGSGDDIVATIQEPMSEDELKASLETPSGDISEVEEIKREKVEEVPEDGADTPAPKAEDK